MKTYFRPIMKCKGYKKLWENIEVTMTNEKALKDLGYITSQHSIVYGSEGNKINRYAYLDEETEKKVIELKDKIWEMQIEISKLVKANEGKIIPLTIDDVIRLKIKGYEKLK